MRCRCASEHMPAWQFAHEYGNRWRTEADVRVLPAEKWAATSRRSRSARGGRRSRWTSPPDRSESTIVACVDGVVEVVDHVPTRDWSPAGWSSSCNVWDPVSVAVDAAGPAGTVAEQLRPVFDRLVVSLDPGSAGGVCRRSTTRCMPGTVRHRPSLVLDQAASLAVKRPVGQAWVWSRVDGGAPLVAASLALWASTRVTGTVEVEPSMIY